MADQQGTTSDAYVVADAHRSWSADAASQGRTGTQRLVEVATVDPADDVRSALGLAGDEQVIIRSRLMLLDDEPVEIASSYYPAAIAAGTQLAEPAKIRGGAVAALASLGFVAVEVVEEVTARLPDAFETDLLRVGEAEPLIVLTRVTLDPAGRPFEYAVNRMVASRTAPLVYRMRTSPA